MLASRFTLSDLISIPSLGLELVAGGPEARTRTVDGVVHGDLLTPPRMVHRRCVLLARGGDEANNEATARGLFAALERSDAAALGISATGPRAAPSEVLLAEARRRRFPVFTVPRPTTLWDVAAPIHRRLLECDLRSSRRFASMQRYLLLGEAGLPLDVTVAQRLSALLGADAGVLRGDRLSPRISGLDARALQTLLGVRDAAISGFSLQGRHGVAYAIGAREPSSWLILAAAVARPPHPLTDSAALAAVPLLAVAESVRALPRRPPAVEGARLLEEAAHA